MPTYDYRCTECAHEFEAFQQISTDPLSTCPECDASLELTHLRERGVKCEKLIALFACIKCDYARETYFCLPVFA